MKLTLILTVLSAVPLSAFAKVGADKYSAYAESRRYCVSRVIEGENVITTWFRNGKPDWILPSVETNRIRSITGAVQNNPLQNERDAAIEEAKPARAVKEAKKNAMKKDKENLEKAIKSMEKARDKSSESMYELYQSILNILNEASES